MPKETRHRITVMNKFVKEKATPGTKKIDGHLTIHKGSAATFPTSKLARSKAQRVAQKYGTPLILFQTEEFKRRIYK